MTESTMYWITRLDQIREFLVGCHILGIVFSIICIMMFIIGLCVRNANKSFGEDDRDYICGVAIANMFKPLVALLVFITFAFSLSRIFIPTTKEMIAIKVIPQIATIETCEKMKNISKDLIDVTAKWLDDINNSNGNNINK